MQWLIFFTVLVFSSFLIAQSRAQKNHGILLTRTRRELSRSSSFPNLQTQLKDDLLQVKKSFVDFQAQVKNDLGIIKRSLFLTHNANILEKRLENCAASLSNGNEPNAKKFWDALRPQLLPPDEAYNLAFRILSKLELNNQTTIKTTLSFLSYIEYPEGFQMLLDKMKLNHLVYNGSDIFTLAYFYRQLCGVSHRGIFSTLPYIVQDVISSAVQIKNVLNRGYLYGNGSGSNNVLTSRSRTTAGTSLWVFNLTSNGLFTIANKYKNNTQLLDEQTEFLLYLVDDESFKIQIAKSENPSIVGKFLGGKVKVIENDGNEFSPVEYLEDNSDHVETFESMKWMVEDSISLQNEKSYQKNCEIIS